MALSGSVDRKAAKPEINKYYRQVAQRFGIAKFIVLLVLIVFFLVTLTLGRSEITLENLQYLMKFISFTNTETSITAPKISYSSGDDVRLELFIGDLAYLSESSFALYDSRGNTIMTSQLKLNYPMLRVSERYALCYDLGGTTYSVYNTFSRLVSETLDYPITDADISDPGVFALATSTREYRTAVVIYDADFKASSRILRENHLTDVKLKPDGSEIAIMTASSAGGYFQTTLELVTVGHDSVRKSTVLDALGYTLFYTDSGFAVVTDEGLSFLDENLVKIRDIRLEQSLVMTDCSGKYLTAVCSTGIVGNNYEATVYDVSGKEICRVPFDGKLASISHDDSGEYVFILAGDDVYRINLVNRKSGSMEVQSGGMKLLAQSPDSFLLAMGNYALTYSDVNFPEQYFDLESEASS